MYFKSISEYAYNVKMIISNRPLTIKVDILVYYKAKETMLTFPVELR